MDRDGTASADTLADLRNVRLHSNAMRFGAGGVAEGFDAIGDGSSAIHWKNKRRTASQISGYFAGVSAHHTHMLTHSAHARALTHHVQSAALVPSLARARVGVCVHVPHVRVSAHRQTLTSTEARMRACLCTCSCAHGTAVAPSGGVVGAGTRNPARCQARACYSLVNQCEYAYHYAWQ